MHAYLTFVLLWACSLGQVYAQTSYASALKTVAPSLVAIEARANGSLSQGSGVIVAPEGMVLTSAHVVARSESASVLLNRGKQVNARVVFTDAAHDVALLQLPKDEGPYPAIRMGLSNPLQPGDVVLAAAASANGPTISAGVLSAVNRGNVLGNPFQPFLQTDAAINPGSSGGALITSGGQMIGLIAANAAAQNGVAFALPTDTLRALLTDWQKGAPVQNVWFGAEGRAASAQELAAGQIQAPSAFIITNVLPRTPAAEAGLQVADMVTTFQGQPIANPALFTRHIRELRVLLGDAVPLTFWRAGTPTNTTLTLSEAPARRTAEAGLLRGYNPLTGVAVEPLSPALANQLGLPLSSQGVAITQLSVNPLSTFSQPFAVGDVLQIINGQPTPSVRAAQGALNTSRTGWEVQFMRAGQVKQVKF
jgi:S1-C subfamily serine protease